MLKLHKYLLFLSTPLLCQAITSEFFIGVGYQFSHSKVSVIRDIHPSKELSILNIPPFDPNLPDAQKHILRQSIGGLKATSIASMCQQRQAICNRVNGQLLPMSVQPAYLNAMLKPDYAKMSQLLHNSRSSCGGKNKRQPNNYASAEESVCNPPKLFLEALQTVNSNLFGAIFLAKKNSSLLSKSHTDLNLVNNNLNTIINKLNALSNGLHNLISHSSFLGTATPPQTKNYSSEQINLLSQNLIKQSEVAKQVTQVLLTETNALKEAQKDPNGVKPLSFSPIMFEKPIQKTQNLSVIGNGASFKLGIMHPFWLFNIAFKNKRIFSWDYYIFLDFNYSLIPFNKEQNRMVFLGYGIGSELVWHMFSTKKKFKKKSTFGMDIYGGGGVAGNSYLLNFASYNALLRTFMNADTSATYFNAFANTGLRFAFNQNAIELDVKFPFLKHSKRLYTTALENATLKYQRHIVFSVRFIHKF
ncbi:outer membrane beta-barrel protein [Helicobacter cetorum]|uniref:Outer membrane protein (Omp6) n=1 Tax=Helicobacter cetorum (strain ATCC BAA-540 / CCUG 52418 / MIT 99-5656) TaxID=1163745 RepID=I0EQW0_HELCM|nr:outer membrane beta-barrel protein [Helicobacter cetorum]AFI05329.1 outer membrane protein (omp6) [Helicobacter cetorum MIT 99-5656]